MSSVTTRPENQRDEKLFISSNTKCTESLEHRNATSLSSSHQSPLRVIATQLHCLRVTSRRYESLQRNFTVVESPVTDRSHCNATSLFLSHQSSIRVIATQLHCLQVTSHLFESLQRNFTVVESPVTDRSHCSKLKFLFQPEA